MIEKTPEKTQVIRDIPLADPGDSVKVSWANLDGDVAIDIRKFRVKKDRSGKDREYASYKGIRIEPSVFKQILKLAEDKEFMKQLTSA